MIKAITSAGDWDCTYHYYYDAAWRLMEERNGSDQVIKQYVWGPSYIDELVQVGINDDPGADDDGGAAGTQDNCDTFYYACQDANFNVLGLLDSTGLLKERYATPYGRRTVFISAGSSDASCMSPVLESRRVTVSGIPQPYGICDVGLSGYLYDNESGLYNVRNRMYNPTMGRWIQRDSAQFFDGSDLYQYCLSEPSARMDPMGLAHLEYNWSSSDPANEIAYIVYDNGSKLSLGKMVWQNGNTYLRATTNGVLIPWSEVVVWMNGSSDDKQRSVSAWFHFRNTGEWELPRGKAGDGTKIGDYWDLRVSCRDCESADAETRCRNAILQRGLNRQIIKGVKIGVSEGIDVTAMGVGGLLVFSPLWPVGAGLFILGAGDAVHGIYELGEISEIASAASKAAAKYCNCQQLMPGEVRAFGPGELDPGRFGIRGAPAR